MNLFQKLALLFKVKNYVNQDISEGKMQTASGKPGWKTTEFWLSIATQLGVVWAAIRGFVPPKTAAIVDVAGAAVYTIARTVAKAVSDIQAAKTAAVAQ